MKTTTDLRVRSKLDPAEMETRQGKCPGDADYDVLLTGATRVSKLDGRPLCVYLPGVLTEAVDAAGVYDVLHELRLRISRNRGMASGSKRFKSNQTRSYTKPIPSAIAGAMDPGGQLKYCRLTSWTGRNLPQWELLHPLLRQVASHFWQHVPERYAAQQQVATSTDPAWVVPGTPFTTITVNNSYPTGAHTDSGDLDEGFSTIAVLRRGEYTGGRLVFPQYRVAVDMQHGDLILMDAHEWHGNTFLTCACGLRMNGCCEVCGAERISLVAYYRTKLAQCGSPEQERAKADQTKERAEQAEAKRFAAKREQ
jgi:hypothetical protein